MRGLAYVRATDAAAAVAAVAADPDARFLGAAPTWSTTSSWRRSRAAWVDVSGLPLTDVESTPDAGPDGGLRIGANVRNSDLAATRWCAAGSPA